MIRSAVTGITLALVIVIIGMVGYMTIEGLSPLDALYMTVITIATVGFKEVIDLHEAGKLFTILLIVSSFGIFGYVVTMVTRYIVDGVFTHYFKDNKVKKKIDKLTDHVILCGFGRNGKQAAADLTDHSKEFLVVEKNPKVVLCGHIHSSDTAPEAYITLKGEGKLIMQTPDDDCFTGEIKVGKINYIPSGWAHRSVNTGKEELVFLGIYPAESERDYSFIGKGGKNFLKIVIEKNGLPQVVDNPVSIGKD